MIYCYQIYCGLLSIKRTLLVAWDLTGYATLFAFIIIYADEQGLIQGYSTSVHWSFLSLVAMGAIYMLWRFVPNYAYPEFDDAPMSTKATILFGYFCIFAVFIASFGTSTLLVAEAHIYTSEPIHAFELLFKLYLFILFTLVIMSVIKIAMAQRYRRHVGLDR